MFRTEKDGIGKMPIWGLDKELAAKWIEDALSPIPEDFAGNCWRSPSAPAF